MVLDSKTNISVRKAFYIIGLLLLIIIILFPIVFTFFNSFIGRREVINTYGSLFGNSVKEHKNIYFNLLNKGIRFEQYLNLLFFKPSYLRKYINSIIMTVPIVTGQVVVSCLASYGFSKFVFPLRDKVFFTYIIVMLMPYQVTLVPNYITIDYLGLIGDFRAIILPGIFGTFGVFLLRQYMLLIPDTYLQAAKMDGAKAVRIFVSIILPQSKSALVALTILSVIDNWNMVEQPIIMLGNSEKYPFSLLLAYMQDVSIVFAAGVLYMIPIICLTIYGHSYLIKGIQMSGLK